MKFFIHTLLFFLLSTQFCFAQWYSQNTGTTVNLNSVQFKDTINGWIFGDLGTILRTTNGGTDWISQPSGTTANLNSVHFEGEDLGWAVGDSGIIINTSDGGLTWTKQQISPEYTFKGVYFIDESSGWIVGAGDSSLVIRTTDGGINWTQQSCIGYGLYDVWFTDLINGITVGRDWIFRTTDGGENWTIQHYGRLAFFCELFFVDSNNGWVVSNYGDLLNTTDGGATWSGGLFWSLFGVSFADVSNGTVVGYEGSIYRTTDGGIIWAEQSSGTTNNLLDVCFIDTNNGWLVGEGGTILYTTNGGVSFIEEEVIDEVPTGFLLSQNFPNPFNPSTSIKYQVASISFVSLVVYDILGNEIETLINEEKSAGTYEITWYAANLPSGVYFYQLKTVDLSTGSGQVFLQTKKMILMK